MPGIPMYSQQTYAPGGHVGPQNDHSLKPSYTVAGIGLPLAFPLPDDRSLRVEKLGTLVPSMALNDPK